MLKEDAKIGMKVVPHDKTVWSDLEDSNSWQLALKRGQNYLFVTQWDDSEECFILSEDENDLEGGDFFNANDFEPYEEGGLKEKLVKLQQLYKEMMELQYEINGEFHNKPISISQMFGGWDDGGFNLRINRVDIRTDDIGILFDVVDGGEEIECIDGIEFDQFIQNVELL